MDSTAELAGGALCDAPTTPAVLQARELLEAGDYAGAIQAARAALKETGSVDALLVMAQQGTARTAFEHIARLHPRHELANNRLREISESVNLSRPAGVAS
jgi:hypothetical protein